MKEFFQLINVVGGLGVFLLGMRIMSDGVQKRAGDRMRRLLGTITSNPAKGVLTGVCVTSLIQSSSGTTVLLVSLVNAGLVTLEQSVGVIMGANIGTTFTAWIVSLVGFKLKITALALPAIAFALPFYFSKIDHRREWAEILTGFGILFLGLHLMKESVPDIGAHPEALEFLRHVTDYGYGSVLLFIGVGTVLTILVQSSSAAMAITITMAFKGWIDMPIAAALVMGENIGTTITAYLASAQMNANAKRSARAHMIFNLLGVVWMLVLFFPFLRLVDWLAPGDAQSAANIPVHLAVFHSLFNATNTLALVWFVPPLSRLVRRMVPDEAEKRTGLPNELSLVRGAGSEAVESNLISIRHELGRMADIVCDMVERTMNGLETTGGELSKLEKQMAEDEEVTDILQEQLSKLLTNCTSVAANESQAQRIQSMQRITNELECVSDSAYSVARLLEKRDRRKLKFHKKGVDELLNYSARVLDFLKYNTAFLAHQMQNYSFGTAVEMEDDIDARRDKLRKIARKKLTKGADVKAELLFLDLVRHLEHIGDYCLNVSRAIRELKRYE